MGTDGPVPVKPLAHTVEVSSVGIRTYDLEANTPAHRSYRARTLYEGTDAPAGETQKVEGVVINDCSARRSMVNCITVTFGGDVVLDPVAIELRRQDGTPALMCLLGSSVIRES